MVRCSCGAVRLWWGCGYLFNLLKNQYCILKGLRCGRSVHFVAESTKDVRIDSNGLPPWCSGTLRVSILTSWLVSVKYDWSGSVPGVPHKSEGDLKSQVLSHQHMALRTKKHSTM